ncbi:MAG: hypothetical protein L3J45_10705 [Flavobacteriaceae bacterium]|nr:hypothetical protein [Flavobacteriaceae bacterium]
MKYTYKFLVILIFIIATSCDKNNQFLDQSSTEVLKSKQSVINSNLESKFDINPDVFDEFVNSIVFDNKGRFRGAIYTSINKEINTDLQNDFWKRFGITNPSNTFISNKSANAPKIYSGNLNHVAVK